MRQTSSRIVRKDIVPAFGDFTVDAITVEQVRDWFATMSERPGVANRAMPVLSMMMRMTPARAGARGRYLNGEPVPRRQPHAIVDRRDAGHRRVPGPLPGHASTLGRRVRRPARGVLLFGAEF